MTSRVAPGRCAPARPLRADDGSILPLVLGYAILAIALALVAAAATSLYLERERLLSVADGAALAGAEAFELDDVVLDTEGAHPRLTDAGVTTATTDYLAAARPAAPQGLELVRARALDGRSASVTLSASWAPPVVSLFVPDGVRLEVTSTARSVFG